MVRATTGEANEIGMRDLLAPRGLSASTGKETGCTALRGISKYVNAFGSTRYIYSNQDAHAVAVLQVMSRDGKSGVITNAFTIKEERRRGIASKLIARARRDFESIEYSNSMSPDGAALVNANPLHEPDFSQSKVVDRSGNLKIVYHGTTADFDTFDESRQGQTAGVDGGFFFTSSEEVAREVYGWDEGGRVMGAQLNLRNPLGLDEYFELTGKDKDDEMGFDASVNYFDNNYEEVLAFAKGNGFDGIMWPADVDSELPHDLIVAFDVDQIKVIFSRPVENEKPSEDRPGD
jgi:hypothetical protein